MVRKKPISIISRLERGIPFSNSDTVILSSEDILDKANKLRDKASKDAYDKYNASLYPVTTINAPEVLFIQGSINTQPVEYNSVAIPSSYSGTGNKFVSDIYNSYYKAVRPKATSDEDAARQASFLAQKAAFETGYGKHVVNTHNYGGHRTKDKGWLSFNSMDDFTTRDVALLDKKWNNWRNSKTPEDFVNAITTNNGYGVYAPRHEYNGYLNMNRRRLTNAGKQTRPKAWIGAAIGAATNILGSVLSANAAKKQAEEQRRLREHQAAIERAEGLNQSLGLMQNAQKEYENRFRVQYSKGGKKSNTEFKITDGGYAIPIGDDTFLLQGSSHDQVNETGQTGIGLDVYAKGGAAKHNQIEAETGEVVEKKPNELRVFSDSIGLNGYSFADLVKMGYNKDELFKIQQTMNNNYGKRKLRNGGCVSSPVGRIKYEDGGVVQYVNGMYQKKVKYPNVDSYYWQIISKDEYNNLVNKGYKVNSNPTGANTSKKSNSVRTSVSVNKTARPRTTSSSIAAPKTSKNNVNNTWGITTPDFYDASKIITGFYNINNNNTVNDNSKKNNTTDNVTNTPQSSVPSINTISQISNTVRTNQTSPTNTAPARTTQRRRLASAAPASTVPTNSTPSIPDYSSQQYIDYIKSQPNYIGGQTDNVAKETTPHFTNPADRDLYNYMIETQNATKGGTTNPVDTELTGNKLGATFKDSDRIGFGAEVIGSIASAIIQSDSANRELDTVPPVRVSPGKLDPNWNIAPRLSLVDAARDRMLRDTDDTFSSAARLNRRNEINLLTNNQKDALWAEKTNKEVELGNQDTLNQQQVNAANVENYNHYLDNLIATRNRRRLGQSAALQVGLSGLTDAVGNFLDQGKQRYADELALNSGIIYGLARLDDKNRNWAIKHLKLANRNNNIIGG